MRLEEEEKAEKGRRREYGGGCSVGGVWFMTD